MIPKLAAAAPSGPPAQKKKKKNRLSSKRRKARYLRDHPPVQDHSPSQGQVASGPTPPPPKPSREPPLVDLSQDSQDEVVLQVPDSQDDYVEEVEVSPPQLGKFDRISHQDNPSSDTD